MRQMACTSGIATTNGALLKVALQDITSRKRVAAKNAHVRTVTSMSKKMALQVFGMEICLGTVRAGKFSVGVLGRDHGVLACSST